MVKPIKLKAVYSHIEQYNLISETTGILTLDFIRKSVLSVIDHYDIQYCYLFGSYAKGNPTPSSDVDLFIDANDIHGLDFYGVIEQLQDSLQKTVDLITFHDFSSNLHLQMEVLSHGVRLDR